MMRLAECIVRHMEPILARWEAFAATLIPGARGLDALALRDHARQILEAVARDLDTPQTPEAQSAKSMGRAPRPADAPETAAQTHAVLRARAGFDINQLIAEYRALRASVLRLWMDACSPDPAGLEDVTRFNEAIDQAIAESVGHFHHTVEQHRNLLLGMLGHDLRNPLNAIVMTASHLASLNAGEEITDAADTLIKSGASMQALLDDLTDFNRTRLGLGLKVVPSETDLAKTVEDELQQLRAAHPRRQIELETGGDLRGRWDGGRLQQLVRNLVSNALRHGLPETPVRVMLRGEEAEVRLEVVNSGQIDPAEIGGIFEPLRRGGAGPAGGEARHGLGLGLFIVREIARAHRGEVGACCEGGQITFTVRLPR